ncbi:MAG: nucleotidyltransferase family protein [bacterium]|jgi:molybdenum cofactor cytidylyltransferase|nr:nucleotidyltransferase family protein [bacterium]
MTSGKLAAVVILAAGEGRRLGKQKALAKYNGNTYLSMILHALEPVPVDCVIVTVGYNYDEVIKAHRTFPGVRFVVNDRPQDGQISSFRCALREGIGSWRTVLLSLVDHPAISSESFEDVLKAANENPRSIIIPTRLGRRGHPVAFPSVLFEELLSSELPEGARTVLKRHTSMILELPLNDPGIVLDVDTPEDCKQLENYLSRKHGAGYNTT